MYHLRYSSAAEPSALCVQRLLLDGTLPCPTGSLPAVTAMVAEEPDSGTKAEATTTRKASGAALRRPLVLLALLLLASTAARAAWISEPDHPASDERYYISAARHIFSLPVTEPEYYDDAPMGIDPNPEHPPLAKVLIGASMKVFGDEPLGWRFPSLAFGTFAVAAMYWLARSAGMSSWEALGAAALMGAGNLFMVYGRFAMLDIFVVVFMLVGVGCYLRQRPALAGVVLGIGACTKLVGFSALAVIAVVELLRRSQERRGLRAHAGGSADRSHDFLRLATCVLVAAMSYLTVLGALDRTVTPFPDPIVHTRRMLEQAGNTTFQAEAQTRGNFTQGALAPVSRPWQWLINDGTFAFHRTFAAPPGQPGSDRTLVDFQVGMSPFVVWLAIPAVLVMAYRAWAYADDASNLALAWSVTTFGLLVAVVLRERISYYYYMLTVLPGLYLALARLFSRHAPRFVTAAYGCAVVASVVAMYPFRSWGGR